MPQPHKRPRSSFVRFEAALPNALWQADTTHWRMADGRDVEILNLVDDHSRLLLASDAFRTVKGADVVQTFLAAAEGQGVPVGLLTDNGAVFTGGPRRAGSAWRPSSSAWGSSPSTRRRTIPRRAARSSASTRPSTATSPSSRRPAR